MPFLSIIIPVYNAEQYLKECFESIKKQDFMDYEVIIVDDGSKDNSPQICDEYAGNDKRVVVYHVKNGGASKARNIGFQKAKGKYIYCMDNDDYILDPAFFSKIYRTLEQQPVDILQTGATYIQGETGKVSKKNDYSKAPESEINKPFQKIYWQVINKKYETSCWTKIIRKDFLLSNQCFFDTTLLVEDLDWNMRMLICVKTYNILKCSDYVHVYRGNSITAGKDEKGMKICLDQISTIEKWGRFFEKYTGNKELKAAMLSYLSYQFFITMGKATTLEDEWRKNVEKKLKEIDFIVKYSIEKKQQKLSILYKVLGFRLTSRIVSFYYNKMRTRVR